MPPVLAPAEKVDDELRETALADVAAKKEAKQIDFEASNW